MKAVVKTAPGVATVDLVDVDEPAILPGHVKIAVRAAGICGTDLHIYHDEYRSWPPVVLGHEVCGDVEEIGAGVDSVAVGWRVTTETYFSTCGRCRFCRGGRINLCPERRSIGSGVNGGFTNYVIVPARNVHRLPESVSYRAGALTEPLACVVHGALELPHLTTGDVAVVAGPGAIGLLTLQVVKSAGATAIMLGTDADERRLELALSLGADLALNVQTDDFRQRMDEVTGGSGADIVYECSGAGPSAQTLLNIVRRGGQYAQIGLFGKPVIWDLDSVCFKELSVTGSNASIPSSWERALALMADGRVRTEALVTEVLPVTEWRYAFNLFEQRIGLKTLLQPVGVNV